MKRLFLLLLLLMLAAPAGATVELRLWAMGLEGELLPEFARGFEAENPGVRVRVQAMSWGGVQEKMIAAALSGCPPDVAQMGTTMMAKFAAMDVLEPLDAPLAAAGVSPADFFDGSRGTATFAGRLLGAPWYVDTRIMLYRREALERAGLARPPETWEEFLAFGRRIMADRRDGLPTVFCDLGGDPLAWFYWQAGGEYNVDDPSRPCFEREPFLAAAEHLLTFYRDGLVPVEYPASGLDYLEEFVRGHYVATYTGPWMVCDLDRKFPGDRERRVAAPFPRKKNRASFIGGSNLVVFRAARNRELALRYVAWASRPETQARWYERSRCLPAVRAAWDRPELSPEVDPSLPAFRAALGETRFPPSTPEWEVVGTLHGRLVERMIRGMTTPAEALDALNAAMAGELAKRRSPAAPGFTLGLGALLCLLPFAAGALYLRGGPAERSAAARFGGLCAALPFLLPGAALLLLFRLAPIAASFVASLTDWNMYGVADLANVHFIGLDNYRRLLADDLFLAACRNTLVFVLVGAPLNIAIALALALALDRYEGPGRAFLRLAFFTPAVVTTVAAALVFAWLYNDASPMNRALAGLGLPPVPWLSNPRFALPSLILFSVWRGFGYNMIIFLAALGNVPRELKEAVRVDGGGAWAEFRHVTLPSLRRTLFVVFVGTVVGNIHFFVEPFVMTGGGPVDSTVSVMFLTYGEGFGRYNLGYASAIIYAVFLFFCLFNLWQGRVRRALES